MANRSDAGNEFLGAGIAFPLGVDAQGQLAMSSLEDHVRQSILLIARTGKSERVMRPGFGAGLDTLVFSPSTSATATLVQQRLKDALVRDEPRIEVLSVAAEIDAAAPETVVVTLQYRVRRTDTTFNLVFPFYLERGQR
jgi:phage baseplate assembly protein W